MEDVKYMSTVTTTHPEDIISHKHPNYLAVFVALALITAVITVTELYIDYIPISKDRGDVSHQGYTGGDVLYAS